MKNLLTAMGRPYYKATATVKTGPSLKPIIPTIIMEKKIIDVEVPKGIRFNLKEIIRDRFTEERKAQVMNPKEIYMRSSHLYSLCPREETLKAMMFMGVKDLKTEVQDTKAFEYGHLLHYWAQNFVFRKYLLGSWKCRLCHKVQGDSVHPIYSPDKCPECGAEGKNLIFEELFYEDKELCFGGHPDGFVVDAGELQALDFKSAHMEAYEGVDKWGMSKGYIWQAHGYMLLTGLKTVRMVYINKNGPDFKEKIIRKDDAILEELIKKLKETIHGVKSVNTISPYIPKRELCETKTCSRAKGCMVRERCFSLP